ncbi:hypothetical protein TWF679_007074 [Orbilia oligospora]|uniref:Uncharacterized protein n=1 Tax=Orbilia oligospora TaxID=2813651 RepID=A0A8H8VL60_ORBOL|nr:hypothetical protein TWF679_007074 [Orbilia oligospora]
MFQFVGKITHDSGYATNELFTVLFPTTIRQGNKVSVVMQWTKTPAPDEVEKENNAQIGTITRVINRSDDSKEVEVHRGEHYYWNEDEMSVVMFNRGSEHCGTGSARLHFKE